MPAPAADAGAALRRAPDGAGLREALLARMRPAAVRAEEWLDAEWEAELAALEAAGAESVPPTDAELDGLAPDPYAGPPDGADAWLADLPGPLLDEYVAATEGPVGPEPIAAGFWVRSAGDGAGFASGGVVDDLAPGPVLAGLAADAAAGVGRLSDDELVGLLRASRRLSSWSASLELTAAGDLMRRRLAQEEAGQPGMAEHADAEVSAALTLTGRAAGHLLDLAMALRRLPLTARALAEGAIDLPRVMVIADEVAGLGDEHIAAVEERVLARAGGQTTTQLRAATRRAVIAADPGAARQRQERAQRDARVERWTEHAGTGALAGRDLPPTGVLAADQHISELARALQAAGLAVGMDQLRALVFVALLSGQPVESLLRDCRPGVPDSAGVPGRPGPPGSPGSPGVPAAPDLPATPGVPVIPGVSATPGVPVIPGVSATSRVPAGSGVAGGLGGPCSPGGRGAPGPCCPHGSGAPAAPILRGAINLTMPLDAWLGLGEVPGEVAGFGPLDAQDSRDLVAAMAQHPQTRWCVTVTDCTGRPVAHGCARPRRGPPGAGPRSRADPGPPAGPGPPPAGGPRSRADPERMPSLGSSAGFRSPAGAGSAAGAGAWSATGAGSAILGSPASIAAWVAAVPLEWLEAGRCAHRRESGSYRPPESLQHLIRVRQRTCAFPGCQRAARRCDLDHTIPYHRGGRTCECNLAPLCREHHQAKQTSGWRLDQPEPGIMIWTTPSGRRYTTGPASY